jgi:aryl-alcohol dehydrogenase-like predicted oxidoreductase
VILGTVQLGIPYGIANRTGQPDYATAREVLAAAWDSGITCLDTAAAYGESEEVIGRALRELGLKNRFAVITKTQPLEADLGDAQEADAAIETSVCRSLARLGVAELAGCLLHREAEIAHLSYLSSFRTRGLVREVGCSVMTTAGFGAALSAPETSMIQAAISVVDRRSERAGLLSAARARRCKVIARSIYLQGLMLMPPGAVPPHLRAILPTRARLDEVAASAGMSLPELLMRAVIGRTEIDHVVVGAESPEMVRQNMEFAARGPLPQDVQWAVDAAVPELEESLITPSRWAERVRPEEDS